jgi:hypothetical protein
MAVAVDSMVLRSLRLHSDLLEYHLCFALAELGITREVAPPAPNGINSTEAISMVKGIADPSHQNSLDRSKVIPSDSMQKSEVDIVSKNQNSKASAQASMGRNQEGIPGALAESAIKQPPSKSFKPPKDRNSMNADNVSGHNHSSIGTSSGGLSRSSSSDQSTARRLEPPPIMRSQSLSSHPASYRQVDRSQSSMNSASSSSQRRFDGNGRGSMNHLPPPPQQQQYPNRDDGYPAVKRAMKENYTRPYYS